jgi:hypothetical protein
VGETRPECGWCSPTSWGPRWDRRGKRRKPASTGLSLSLCLCLCLSICFLVIIMWSALFHHVLSLSPIMDGNLWNCEQNKTFLLSTVSLGICHNDDKANRHILLWLMIFVSCLRNLCLPTTLKLWGFSSTFLSASFIFWNILYFLHSKNLVVLHCWKNSFPQWIDLAPLSKISRLYGHPYSWILCFVYWSVSIRSSWAPSLMMTQ